MKQLKEITMKKSLLVSVLLIAAILLLIISLTVMLNNSKSPESTTAQIYTYTIINTFPHDPHAFTEGLVYQDGFLYESTGLNGASSLRRVNLTSGAILQEVSLSNLYFGEGLAIVGDKIVQLTYTSQVGFVYDKNSFSLLNNFTYPTQGWGLAYDGKRLIISDGSDTLYFLNPETYQRTGQIQVHDGNASVVNINELEYVNGDIYANIFLQPTIAIINPETGKVKSWIDLNGLQVASSYTPEDVLNGIAYDAENSRLFVTGKNWSQLYEIKLVPAK
jgi:glutaminyl-peptide cyclotransferase